MEINEIIFPRVSLDLSYLVKLEVKLILDLGNA